MLDLHKSFGFKMNQIKIEELAKLVLNGKIKFHEVENEANGDSNLATIVRRRALEQLLNLKLENIGKHSIDFNSVVGRNIENSIGAAQVPMGIAGPLKVNGDYAKGEFFIPLCTTEGALVASVNRGCSAITRSGGANSKVIRDAMTRAPLFKVPSLEHAEKLVEWVRENFGKVREVAEKTTRHGKLVEFEPYIVGTNVFLRFIFQTGDAMGMNMVTIACDEIRKLIEKECKYAKCVSLSGNVCVDKKASAMNLIRGRGKTVVAEAKIKRKIVEEVLKTVPEAICEVNWRKNYVGSALAGSYGFNAHYANVIAAIFIACGQDAAQIVESSMGITTAELTEEGDLHLAVTLPSLEVGTVGGGTRLPTQSEALKILGCYGGGNPAGFNAKKFAEIVAAAVLAGELSLLGALAAQHLATAHLRLGRGKSKT